jgi:CBS domain containing-hemolysin-like protein
MQPLHQVQCVSSRAQVSDLREVVKKSMQSFFPVFHRTKQKIVGYIYPNDVLSASSKKRIEEYTEPAYFVSEEAQALDILTKLQEEELDAAIVLNVKGEAQGIIFLEELLDELFGSEPKRPRPSIHYLEKTISADMSIDEFNKEYGTLIDSQGCKTFAELIEKLLERAPHPQDNLQLETVEILVKETSLFKAKTIQIRTKI